jgi:hypothetical protein
MQSDWLILHGGALGDLILTIQLGLRLIYTDANAGLEVISRADCGDLSNCRPRILRRSAEGLGLHWLFADNASDPPAPLAQVLGGRRVLCALADCRSSVHRRLLKLRPRQVFSFDPRPRAGLSRHILTQWQADLEAQGLLFPKCIHHRHGRQSLWVPAEMRARGVCTLLRAGASPDCAVIHPGSGGRAKSWPLANFLALAHALAEIGRSTCFLIGPAELEWWPAADRAALRHSGPVIENPTADELAAILAAASVLIASDCGPAHLAGLLGTPTLVIFGPTSDALWRPLGPQVRVIRGDPQQDPSGWKINPQEVADLAAAISRPALQESSACTAR